jgi:hypothetical protein
MYGRRQKWRGRTHYLSCPDLAHKIGGCVLSKNAGERYGRTKYGAACQKCWMTNMEGTKCLPKMLDTDMGRTKLIVLLLFFCFYFDSAPCLFFLITTCRNKLGGVEERSMDDRRMVVKDGNTKRPATSDANARKFNNTARTKWFGDKVLTWIFLFGFSG